MEYRILKAGNISLLMLEVNNLLSKGWTIQGGVSFSIDEKHDEKYVQAMIRKIKKDK